MKIVILFSIILMGCVQQPQVTSKQVQRLTNRVEMLEMVVDWYHHPDFHVLDHASQNGYVLGPEDAIEDCSNSPAPLTTEFLNEYCKDPKNATDKTCCP